jgi:hypothetical protein
MGQISVDARNNEAIPVRSLAYSMYSYGPQAEHRLYKNEDCFVDEADFPGLSIFPPVCSFKVGIGIDCALRQRTARVTLSHDITQDGEIMKDRILPPMTGFD